MHFVKLIWPLLLVLAAVDAASLRDLSPAPVQSLTEGRVLEPREEACLVMCHALQDASLELPQLPRVGGGTYSTILRHLSFRWVKPPLFLGMVRCAGVGLTAVRSSSMQSLFADPEPARYRMLLRRLRI